jgi:hypothetical protein
VNLSAQETLKARGRAGLSGYYLFHLDDAGGVVTDTSHDTIAARSIRTLLSARD